MFNAHQKCKLRSVFERWQSWFWERKKELGMWLAEVRYKGWNEGWNLRNCEGKGSYDSSLKDLKKSVSVSKLERVKGFWKTENGKNKEKCWTWFTVDKAMIFLTDTKGVSALTLIFLVISIFRVIKLSYLGNDPATWAMTDELTRLLGIWRTSSMWEHSQVYGLYKVWW